MIRSKVASLVKKDVLNPSNVIADACASFVTSGATQAITSTIVFKSDQYP